eukprot:EG_transcript_12961
MRRFLHRCLPQWLTQLNFVPCQPAFISSQRISLATSNPRIRKSLDEATVAAAKPRIRKSLGEATVAAGEGSKKRGKEANEAVQSLFKTYNIDIVKVIQRYPAVRAYDVRRVERVTSYLAGLGVNVKRVVENRPVVLAGHVEAYDTVVQWLRHNKADVVRVVDTNPSILFRSIGALQETGDAICSCGHSVAEVAHRFPAIFRTPSAGVSLLLELRRLAKPMTDLPDQGRPSGETGRKLALLSSLGLDADCLLRKAPQILSCSLKSIFHIPRPTADSMALKIMQSAPQVLGQRPEALQTRLQFFAENGLDVLKHVNGAPTVLTCSVERKLQPTLKFVLEEMGRSQAELDNASNLWTYDLNGRLRPRLLYLRSLGKESPKGLAPFGSFSDQRFATYFAETNLEHYYAWRRQNGYPVPRNQCRVGDTAHPT